MKHLQPASHAATAAGATALPAVLPKDMVLGHTLIGELWRFRELFYFLVWRDVKVRYKQSVLGAAWAIIQPFFMMVVFTIFFGKLGHMPTDEIEPAVFYYSALLPWTYFSTSLGTGGISLESNRELITKVYFPKLIVPATSAIRGLLDFGIASIMLAGMMIWYRVEPTWQLLWWPVLLVPLVAFTTGCCLIFAALNVKYRDIKHALPFVVQLGLFITPIIYPLSKIPMEYHRYIALYPMVGLIQAFRATLVPGQAIETDVLIISVCMAFAIFLFSVWYFQKTEKTFADIV